MVAAEDGVAPASVWTTAAVVEDSATAFTDELATVDELAPEAWAELELELEPESLLTPLLSKVEPIGPNLMLLYTTDDDPDLDSTSDGTPLSVLQVPRPVPAPVSLTG